MLLSKALLILIATKTTAIHHRRRVTLDKTLFTKESTASQSISCASLRTTTLINQVESQDAKVMFGCAGLNTQKHRGLGQNTVRDGENITAANSSMDCEKRARGSSQLLELASRDTDTATVAGVVVGVTLLSILAILCLTVVLCDRCGRR